MKKCLQKRKTNAWNTAEYEQNKYNNSQNSRQRAVKNNSSGNTSSYCWRPLPSVSILIKLKGFRSATTSFYKLLLSCMPSSLSRQLDLTYTLDKYVTATKAGQPKDTYTVERKNFITKPYEHLSDNKMYNFLDNVIWLITNSAHFLSSAVLIAHIAQFIMFRLTDCCHSHISENSIQMCKVKKPQYHILEFNDLSSYVVGFSKTSMCLLI